MEIKVGEIIRAKREEQNYTLIDFAKKIDISPGYLSQLENGKKDNPKLEILIKIIRELEIDLDMLLGLESSTESLNSKIPSLLKLTLAKDRYSRVLGEREVLKKTCSLLEKLLESKYLIENKDLYDLFLEDMYIQMETTIKRYKAIQLIKEMGALNEGN